MAAVLHISQVKFDEKDYNGSNSCEITTNDVLDNICHVLKVKKEMVFDALTCKTPIVMGKEMQIFLDKAGCASQSEAFAKDIYSKMFNWVIKYLNIALLPEPEQLSGKNPASIYKKIGLLDIFGFEIFDLNSLEQLCINFTNEKLHQLYVEYVFTLEVQTFINEGLKDFLGNLSFKDNQEVIDTLTHAETKKFAIFNLIDDQSATMSKDMNLIDQFKQLHVRNTKVTFSKTKINMFIIVHTARPVGYTIDGFCEKNKDEVPRPILKCMLSSEIKEIVDIYTQKVRPNDVPVDYLSETTKKKESFIGYKFRQQMDALMKELRSCQCSFMRCIKPNEQKSATVWTSSLVVLQIRYLGLLDSIKIRKESYPYRFTFKNFVHRYLELEPSHSGYTPSELDAMKPNYIKLSRNILSAALPNHDDKTQLCGKTRVFLKIEAYQDLEVVYEMAVKAKKLAIISLDSLLLEVKLRNRIVDTRQKGFVACDMIKLLMTDIKAKLNFGKFTIIRRSVLIMQKNFRMRKVQGQFKEKQQALKNIQSGIEAFLTHNKLREKQNSARIILRYYRNGLFVASLKFYVTILKTLRTLVKNATSQSELKHKEKAVITVQRHVRGRQCRQNNADIVKKIEEAKMRYKRAKATQTIKRFVMGRITRKRIRKIMKSAAIIQAYFKMIWTRHAYKDMKEKTILLQREIRNYLVVKRKADAQRLKYLKEEYIPFLIKCRSDQSKLYDLEEEQGIYQKQESREIKPEKKLKQRTFDHIPPMDTSFVHRARIFTEVIDLDFLEDTLESYQGSWADGYIDSCLDARNNKSDCRVIEVGTNHSIVATTNGRCYTWGSNGTFQLGVENKHETMGVFRVLKGEEKLQYIAIGDETSHILTKEKMVFSFGKNDKGQLGLGHKSAVEQITLNERLSQSKLKSIHTKGKNNFGITETGSLLFWPCGPEDPRVGLLKLVGNESINHIVLGDDYAILLSGSGQLFSFGTKNEFGQLGLGHNEKVLSPTPIRFESKERICSVSTGRAHSLCISKNNKTFAWGEGSQGQLGTGDTQNRLIPTLIKLPIQSKCVQLCCSYYGSYALIEDGVIYWWGRNSRIRQVTQPTLFRPMTHPELYPIQIRSSWSSKINVAYLEIVDLRYVKDMSMSLKYGYTKQMAAKWNTFGNSQCMLI